jgi:hypothetical protein
MKLESKYFAFLYIALTFVFAVYQLMFNSFDFDKTLEFFLIVYFSIELLFFLYSKYNYLSNNWKIIGKYNFKINGMFIYFIFLFGLTYFINFLNKDFIHFFYNFYFLVFFIPFMVTRNYHLIIKENYFSIIEVNSFKDFSKDEIKVIAIKNNNLVITINKNNKSYSFPIEDFKLNELNLLNEYIRIENIKEYIK